MKIIFLAAIFIFNQSQNLAEYYYDHAAGFVDCERIITGTNFYGHCQHIINKEEVEEGGRVFVDCSARSLFIPNSDVTSLHLYHWARQDSDPRLLASYSINGPDQNYTITVDPVKYWKVARSQKWDRRHGSMMEMINRLQLAIYNFTVADVGEYICYAKRTQGRGCRCFGTVRLKGIMSMLDKEVLNERERFTVTCTLNTMNVLPNGETLTDYQSKRRYRYYHIYRRIYGDDIENLLISTHPTIIGDPIVAERPWRVWKENSNYNRYAGPNKDYVMKLDVTNTICSDSGLYFCCIQYDRYDIAYFGDEIFVCSRTHVVIKAPLDEFIFDVSTREGRVEYLEGATINMICSIQGPKDITFDWRFGRKHRNGNMIDFSYPHHNHAKTTASIISKPGFDNCPYYQHKSHLSFRAERRYNGYKFYCVVYCHGKVARHGNTTLFVQTRHIGRGENIEGDDVILSCPVDSLSDRFSKDSFGKITTIILMRKTVHDSNFTVMAVNGVKGNEKPLRNRTNLTEPMVSPGTWIINNNYTSGLQITMKQATTGDSGMYVCQVYFIFGTKLKNVNITQEVVIKAKAPLVAAKPDHDNKIISSSVIAGIVISFILVFAVAICVAAWYLLKNDCKKGKEMLDDLRFKWKVCPVVRWFQRLYRKMCRKIETAERTVEYTQKYCAKSNAKV